MPNLHKHIILKEQVQISNASNVSSRGIKLFLYAVKNFLSYNLNLSSKCLLCFEACSDLTSAS